MIHIAFSNPYKRDWIKLYEDRYEILEWSSLNDRKHVEEFYPEIDFDLFPTSAVNVFSTFSKLYDYGGLVVGNTIKPIENINLSNVTKLTYFKRYSGSQRLSLLISPRGDPTTLKFLNKMKEELQSGLWKMPQIETEAEYL